MIIFLLVTCLCTLSEGVVSLMDDYRFAGYSFQWNRGLYLHVDEPYTFLIYPGINLEGVLCGVGGNAVFDLQMELHRGDLNIIDTEPDDMPVLRFVTGSEPVAYGVTVTAVDMLYGATADSVYVFFAMRPLTVKIENSVPGEPDLAITGE